MESPQDGRTGVHVSIAEGKKGRRKVGRPITYQGSPSSLDLSPEERRVILRRIANRESARRVRDRRNEELNKFIQRAEYLEQSNAILRKRLEKCHTLENKLQGSLAHLEKNMHAKDRENAELCTTIALMREATPHPMRSSINNLLHIPCSFEPSTEVPIEPITPNISDASWHDVQHALSGDHEWQACLHDMAEGDTLHRWPDSFLKTQNLFTMD